jgi:hypothetical protein
MRGAILTPFTTGPAQQAGPRIWRKRVLPVGHVEYKGRMLNFTKGYNDQLAGAFAAAAYDQVPFQLADAKNTHTNDPERYRGSIIGMDSRDDGLWVTLAPTTEGEEVILQNPQLGVSARIVEDYARSDGKFFPAAVQHVLGTLDPRIPGLGAWQAVEMAGGEQNVLDLTGFAFTTEGTMPDLDAAQQAKLAKLLQIPESQLDQLVAGLGTGDLGGLDPSLGDLDAEISDEELALLIADLPAEELALLEQEFLTETAAAAQSTGLSQEAQMALELTAARADENDRQLRVINTRLAASEFQRERRRLIEDLGLPPRAVDMAKPLLQGAGHVIEFSNDQGQAVAVDAGQVMRAVLDEIGKTSKMLDLGFELGSSFDEPEQHQQAATARADLVKGFRQITGI